MRHAMAFAEWSCLLRRRRRRSDKGESPMRETAVAPKRRAVDARQWDAALDAFDKLAHLEVRPPAGTLLDCSSHALVASRAGAEFYSCGRGRCGQRGVRNVFDSYELERLCHAPLRTADRPVVSVGCGVLA
ncbi:hypothetical protein M885DRAFT_568930 [Pelagophyceae sp. CCMP2097]|nr:hypothetical protein M885DRAFT_568930 [Pelagophyceae sp. CCMP2097]